MVATPRDHKLATHAAVPPLALTDQPILVSRPQFGGDMHRFLARLILPPRMTFDATIIDVGPGWPLSGLIGSLARGGTS